MNDPVQAALSHYDGWEGARAEKVAGGLINDTFVVQANGGRAVLQRVSAIFPPGIQENIDAVTRCLAANGLVTPTIVATRDGRLFVDSGGNGVWRMMTFVDGVCFDVVGSVAQASAAGRLVGRFHGALDTLVHAFTHVRKGAHDTPRHLQRLATALGAHGAHRFGPEVRPLGESILAAAAALPPLPPLRVRVCHGDLKFNNVRFAGVTSPASERALCLIDLDTVGPLPLAYELGDAWRSWCNRAGEDEPQSAFDLEIFRASWDGYRDGLGVALSIEDRQALLLSVEWISVELAARFATDALEESYFGWDPKRFATRGDHNLVRARGQFSLHQALVASRGERARLLDVDG